MTLILGHASPDIGFLVADTLLSFPNARYDPRDPVIEKFHALKIHILNSDVAVAFAGDVESSLAIIRHLHQDLAADPMICVPERLLNLHREVAARNTGAVRVNCEFLALLLTSEEKKLVRVTNGQMYDVQRAYIGDADEYANLRSLMHPYAGPESRFVQNADGTFSNTPQPVTNGEKEFDQVSDAMEKLTHQRRSETVGAICGCVTRVVDARISGKLEYMQSVEVSIYPWEGHAGFSLLAANTGSRGVGIYYLGWHAGLLFIVGDSVTCRKEAAATIEQFVEVARSKYGVNLEGGTW